MFLDSHNHISADLETLGTDGQPALLALGAVRFNPEKDLNGPLDTFYRTIDIQSCLDAGMTIDGSTLHWWVRQDREALAHAFGGGPSLRQVLDDFYFWSSVQPPGEEGYLWGWSASFDCTHIETACRLTGATMPFDFRHQLCGRTIAKTAFPEGIKYEDYQDTRYPNHHALGDAIRQARIIRAALRRLGVV